MDGIEHQLEIINGLIETLEAERAHIINQRNDTSLEDTGMIMELVGEERGLRRARQYAEMIRVGLYQRPGAKSHLPASQLAEKDNTITATDQRHTPESDDVVTGVNVS